MSRIIEIDQQLLLLLNGSDSLFLDAMIRTFTSGITWIPLYLLLLYLIIKNNDTMGQILLTVGCAVLCVAITAGITNLMVKPWVARLRPCNDPMLKYAVDIVAGTIDGDYSFFSAHAANTFGLAVFFSLLVRRRGFTVTLILWSLLNCYTRLYLGLHYPGDILCGLLFGGMVGTMVWRFSPLRRMTCSKKDESWLLLVMSLIVAFAVVRAWVICLFEI